MIKASEIHPDVELRDYLQGHVVVTNPGNVTSNVVVYCEQDRPTTGMPDDFISIVLNGNASCLGADIDFASGYIMVVLYCRMNDNGSVKSNRINKILAQFDEMLDGACTENYFFRFEKERFIMPTSPDQSSGYSSTILNLRWTTNNNFSKS